MAQCGGQTAVTCQMCEKTSQIKMKCFDCDYLLCANCCQLHKKVKELRDHQLVDLQNIGSIKDGAETKINLKNIDCRSHPGQNCCLFCKECDKVVCAICISETHNQHKMIKIGEGHKLQINKISTWHTDIKMKIDTLTADMATLNSKYSTENSKYNIEKDKIFDHDKVLKEAVDTQTKTLVCELDERWYEISKVVKDEISHANRYKQSLESREEHLKQALESSNAGDLFRAIEEEQKKRHNPDRPVNLKFGTLPTFKTREINDILINSLHGTLLETELKIHVVGCYKTDSLQLNCVKCKADGTFWIYHFAKEMLNCVEKHDNGTLTSKNKFEVAMKSMALTPNGDLLLSVGKSHLLVIPHSQKTIKKSQYSVSPLVTTYAVHVAFHKIILGAKESGPLYPANGPRQIIVMDTQGKYEKVYEFDINKRPLFTNPRRVVMDSMNNLYVLDRKCEDLAGRVVTINNCKGKIIIYNGHPKVNNQIHPFTPADLVATKSDSIVLSDVANHFLHILNSDGDCIKYINTEEHGIKRPWSLDIDKRDLLHIGCDKNDKEAVGLSSNSKLYVIKFTGF